MLIAKVVAVTIAYLLAPLSKLIKKETNFLMKIILFPKHFTVFVLLLQIENVDFTLNIIMIVHLSLS